ncbi:hypothetical protein GCM10011360_10930 [Primorskyibacter flagellatus]|uniref:DUF4198 domain-containing protein n=1 Tax=Primorskyibacter flagellatus TaxID=1387277 RepID=A0A917A3P0_9RHOB|nr:DUF4198 domain-containing protein [Primorskyibacter flagellatus]GGE24251.1 hypothetical protein GCM10011360_10930 [Primorskyibacter flagellatus]
MPANRSFGRMTRLIPITISLLLTLTTMSRAHEFWLEPQNYQADPGARVDVDIRNGQDFKGLTLSWFDPRIQKTTVLNGGRESEYNGLPGDLPAISVDVGDELIVLSYASTLSELTYDSWDKVKSFVQHKDIAWFFDAHSARGLPEDGVTEGYWRFSKTLIAGGEGAGSDADTGMETEFVALTNPYTDNAKRFTARLLYRGAPRPDAQVELWEKRDGEVTRTIHRTDTQGLVTVPVRPGYSYMLDAVVLREPASDAAKEAGVMWESLWANLTFAVPD